MRVPRIVALFFFVAFFATSSVSAQPRTTPIELEFDPVLTASLTLGAGLGFIALNVIDLNPETCNWCKPLSIDDTIRNALVWDDRDAADSLSNVSLFAIPAIAYGGVLIGALADNRGGESWENMLFILEAVSIASLANTILKLSVARRRPFVNYGTETAAYLLHGQNTSFPSGHTSLAAVLTSSASTVAYLRGYRFAPFILGAGSLFTLLTAYARIGADAHYFVDVTTALVMSAGIGFAVPFFLHGRKSHNETAQGSLRASPNSFSFSWNF